MRTIIKLIKMNQKEIIYLVVGVGLTYFLLKNKGYTIKKFGKDEK